MAVSIGTPTQIGATTGQNPSFSHTHAGGTELVVLVAGRRADTTTVISSVTYDGAAMTAVETSPNSRASAQFGSVSAYRLADPGGKTATVQINWSSANVNNTAAWAIDIAGSVTGAGIVESSGSGAGNTVASVTVTYARTANDTYSIYFAGRTKGPGSPTWTPTAPLTELIADYDGDPNTLSCTVCGAQESSSGSLARVSTCSTSGGTAALCISIATASGASAGSLSGTLGAATASASGALAIAGSATATLGAVGISASATLGSGITGAASATLGALGGAATGALALRGGLTGALGAAALSASATLGSGAALGATLGAITATASGALAVSGTLSGTLGGVLAAATAGLALRGSASATLAAANLAGTGTLALQGTLAATLGAVSLHAEQGGTWSPGSRPMIYVPRRAGAVAVSPRATAGVPARLTQIVRH